ncbi:MAG TPA: TonB-dependent receptor [Bryobacteraceae bacterium]|nr:TonB-dependent receptor [Bryobacteraceae bacterium]
MRGEFVGVRWGCRVGVVVLGLVLFIAAVPVFAQLPTGTILGTAKDPSGGVVPRARVTAQNAETGTSRSITTDDAGAYRLAGLPVGHYDLRVDAAGFKPTIEKGLVLDVGEEAVLNFALEVGTTSDQVVVTGEAPLVNTTTASLGGLVNEKRLAELPLNGRNYLDLVLLQPGVSQDTVMVHLGGGGEGTTYSSNGAPIISNNFLLDGTPTQNVLGYNGASAVGSTLGLDGIREYKVITNAFGAEYGMNMGSQMTIVSKGGTNQFHGDAFEYLRNRVLDARNFFDTSYGQCLTANGSDCKRNPPYERNNFGGAFGGPIRKDKTFFWGVYEGLRQVKGNPVRTKSIPPACVANGTRTVAQGNPNGADFNVTPADCGGLISGPITTNPAIRPLLALYDPADSNYTQLSNETVNYGQMRVDQNFSDKDSLFGRYTIEDALDNVPGPGFGASVYGFKEFQNYEPSRSQFITLSESHIFSPALLNTARVSFSRTNILANFAANPSQTGQAVDGPGVSFANGQPVGLVVIGSNGSGSPSFTTMGPDFAAPNFHLQNYWSLGEDLFYTKGKHALKLGFLGNRLQLITGETVWSRGRVNYLGGLPAFLQNQPSQELAAIPGGIGRRHFRYETYGFYGQDDWRATSRLTLNFGLRYEFNTTPEESQGYQNTILNPGAEVDVVGGPNWTSPLTTQPFIRNPSLKDFSPRFGFAYDPIGKGKTSIRGAFGIYYDIATIGSTTFGYVVGDPPYRSINAAFPKAWASGFISASPGPFQPPFIFPGATSTFQGFFPPSPLNIVQHDIRQPYLESWNFSIDQQLPGNVALTASYVGTKGLHLWGQGDVNACIPTGYVNGLPNWANTQGKGGAPAACPSTNLQFPAGHICTVNTSLGTTLHVPSGRANCNFGSDSSIQTNSASWYNGLQVSVQKRLSHGLEFQSAYTYSKTLDLPQGRLFIDGEALTPEAPLMVDRGRAIFDATHNWRFNTLYTLPTSKSTGLLSKLVNGWSMQNIVSAQTGFPFSPAAPGDVSLNAFTTLLSGYERPDQVTSDNLSRARQSNPNAVVYNPATVITGDPNRWFNPNMFTSPLPGFLGNMGRGTLNGPGLFNWDFSLHKDTPLGLLGEAGNLQFRAEFFNILNRANFINNPPNGNGIVGPSAGALTAARDGRDIQFALKVSF